MGGVQLAMLPSLIVCSRGKKGALIGERVEREGRKVEGAKLTRRFTRGEQEESWYEVCIAGRGERPQTQHELGNDA